MTVSTIFEQHGLSIFDVQELTTHGGSLRIYARHRENANFDPTDRVDMLLKKEHDNGLGYVNTYTDFAKKVYMIKRALLQFLIKVKNDGKSVVGYGAAAKGNTLLNYCGIRQDFLDYVVDRSPHKQGKYLPGTHIPVIEPQKVFETQPDYLLILPWNLREEVMEQMSCVRAWGGKFIVPIPHLEVFE
jgi:hypothetical protein